MLFEMTPFERNYRSLMRRDPFAEFEKNFFGSDFSDFFNTSLPVMGHFQTDVRDNGDSFLLEADLPGFKKEDITVDVKDHLLTIKAERHSDYEDKDQKNGYLRQERSYGSYTRSFNIDRIDESGIKAAYTDGVLKLTLPKLTPEVPASQHITIE